MREWIRFLGMSLVRHSSTPIFLSTGTRLSIIAMYKEQPVQALAISLGGRRSHAACLKSMHIFYDVFESGLPSLRSDRPTPSNC